MSGFRVLFHQKANEEYRMEGDSMQSALANTIKSETLNAYPLFKEFCLYKEKGLRKQSLKSLNHFIQQALEWDFIRQQQFISWVFEIFEISDNVQQILVHPLEVNMCKPLLERWMDLNPRDSRPYRWYGLFLNIDRRISYLNKALELGGDKEQLVIIKIIDMYIDSLWYSFHHISEDLHIGNINEDWSLINKIEDLSGLVKNDEYKKNIYQNLSYYRNLLNDWISFSEEGRVGFVQWCEERGKFYKLTKTYYYEK